MCEKATNILTHRAVRLTNIKQKSSLHKLHNQVDKVFESARARLYNETLITKVDYSNNVIVAESAKNLYFVSKRFKIVF